MLKGIKRFTGRQALLKEFLVRFKLEWAVPLTAYIYQLNHYLQNWYMLLVSSREDERVQTAGVILTSRQSQ